MASTSTNATANKIPPLDAAAPSTTETATFALGCFWSPDARFGVVPGVVRTRVGYTGGSKQNPSYHDLGDHTETVQIDYDPAQTSYEKLLEVFWSSHSPTWQGSSQYKSALFVHNEAQEKLAEENRALETDKASGVIYTEIIPATEFYLAEDYHQKYQLRHAPKLLEAFSAIYPDAGRLVASTAAARVNGYVAGYGSFAGLQAEIDGFGLSPEASEWLQDLVKKSDR